MNIYATNRPDEGYQFQMSANGSDWLNGRAAEAYAYAHVWNDETDANGEYYEGTRPDWTLAPCGY
tara:strand:- start:644 stop:838 length:195 start_codon:yes stop_codon:yes gene_type:complete